MLFIVGFLLAVLLSRSNQTEVSPHESPEEQLWGCGGAAPGGASRGRSTLPSSGCRPYEDCELSWYPCGSSEDGGVFYCESGPACACYSC